MDFSLTEASQDLAGLTRRIVADHVTPDSLGPHGTGGFDEPLWRALAQAGVLDAALPDTVGGGGFGLLEQCAILVELGRGVAPVPYLPTIVAAATALAADATPSVLERTVVPVVRGERVLAAALPDAGAPASFTAERDGERWRVSGAQTAVPFGAFADTVLVQASTPDGDVLALVDAEGATVSPQRTVDHADAALVELSGAAGEPVSASPDDVRARSTIGLCAWQLGVLERAVELTAAYAAERRQFGHAIGGFQAVRHRLADAHLDVEGVRLTLWQAAWRHVEGLPSAEEVATAKYWAAEAGHRVAHTAVHVHGGVGIDVDHELHRYFVAAKRAEFELGGATAQLRALGELLA